MLRESIVDRGEFQGDELKSNSGNSEVPGDPGEGYFNEMARAWGQQLA